MEAPLSTERVRALATGDPATAGVHLEVPGVSGFLAVRADPARVALASACEKVFGLAVPDRLRYTATPDRRLRWMSPDEYLLSCGLDDVATLEREFARALDGAPGVAITDVSGAWCPLVLGGPKAREVLAQCVPIDLDPRAFGDARVASTVFAKANATLANLGDGRIEIVVRRSLADYVLQFIARASAEHGLALTGTS